MDKGVVVLVAKVPSQTPTSSPKLSSTPTPVKSSQSADSLVSDLTPSVGHGIAPQGAQGNGPWATGIRLASSTDGITFSPTGDSLTDQASVPNLVQGNDKRLRCYYINFQGNQKVVAIQTAPGKWI